MALLLCRFGCVFGGIKLRPLDFAVLCWLSGQGPGIHYHQKTIGEALGLGHDAVHDALNRLRNRPGHGGYGVALVYSERIKIKTFLPSIGRKTDTKLNRYWLTGALVEILQRESDHQARVAAKKKPLAVAPESPESPAPAAARSKPADVSWAEPEIQQLAAAFDRLGLATREHGPRRPCGRAELQALRNRVREGCELPELGAAIVGAAHTVWQRTDGTPWAIDPFAVVFARRDSVARYAARGREAAKALPAAWYRDLLTASEPDAPESPPDAADVSPPPASRRETAAVFGSGVEPSSMTAVEPSSTGSSRSPDRDLPLKIATAGPVGYQATGRAGYRPPMGQARPIDATARASSPAAKTPPPKGLPERERERERRGEGEQKQRQKAPSDATAAHLAHLPADARNLLAGLYPDMHTPPRRRS